MMLMNKGKYLMAISVIMISLLTGCGNTIPEMTEEQQAQIVEYATGLLLKYDTMHEKKLVNLEETEAEEQSHAEQMPAATQKPVMESSEEKDFQPEVTEVIEAFSTVEDIAGFLQMEYMDFIYSGYEVADSYPKDRMEDSVFAVEASSNNKLIILHFDLLNKGASDQQVDMMKKNLRFEVALNGGSAQNALFTLLLDDMASFKGTIPAYGTEPLIIITEIPADNQEVTSVTLSIKNAADEILQISLQ